MQKWLATLISVYLRDIYPIVTPKDNRRLSDAEFLVARQICREVFRSVQSRPQFVSANGVDPEFGLPAANWSYEAPNEFVNLFVRVSKSENDVIENLRAFTQVFSGYNLYQVCDGKGLSVSSLELTDQTLEQIKLNLRERGVDFVPRNLLMIEGLPTRYVFKPPSMLGECGYSVGGTIVNRDTNGYQERINLIFESGIGNYLDGLLSQRDEIRILEIGGGYGALAYWFKQAFPKTSYSIVDLPECILFSRLYLTLTMPDIPTSFGLDPAKHGIRFIPNFISEQLEDSFDLVINTLSMSEMSAYQVERYVDLIKNVWIKDEGLFFEQNQDNRSMGLPFTQGLFASKFSERLDLNPRGVAHRNGYANIWSNHPIVLKTNSRKQTFSGLASFVHLARRSWRVTAG